ncbi:MAG: helix-turn-helix domain-containing protein [Candidatus Tyrphobacter sp.]
MRNGKPSDGSVSPEIFTPAEAAQYLRLSRKKLDRVLRRGEIPHRREGRSILITRAALDSWLRLPPRPNGEDFSRS